MTLDDLTQLAQNALESDPEGPEIIEIIERYFDAFEAFAPRLLTIGRDEEEKLQALAAKHAAVLELTTTLRDETSRELRSLKLRGKGIRAYKDIYPKRISLGKGRKG